MRGLSLFWPVDAGGYSQKWVESTKETLAHAGHGYVIARAGGELVAKRDVMKVPALYSVFARWPENTKLLPKHALEFVQTYGFLRKGKHLTEFADDIIDEMKAVRHLLALRDAGKWSAITKLGTINNEKDSPQPRVKIRCPADDVFRPGIVT